jgi:DNA-directed RNA polymerase specialized sigma24 family protein
VTRTAGPAVSSAENNVLCGLYQQVTEQQASPAGASYDLTAGLARYRVWLGERTLGPDLGADRAVQVLFDQHYRSLVRLAALLLRDAAAAEDVVQDAFVAVHDAWGQLQDTGRALAYLRRCVVAGSRSRLDQAVLARIAPGPAPGRPVTGRAGPAQHSPELVAALHALPACQREAVVLRYYAGLAEPEVAAVMGISHRSAGKHLARARLALQGRLPAVRGLRPAAS